MLKMYMIKYAYANPLHEACAQEIQLILMKSQYEKNNS